MAETLNIPPAPVNFTGNPIRIEIGCDIAGATVSNLMVICVIRVYSGEAATVVATARREVVNGGARFNLQSYLTREHVASFSYPTALKGINHADWLGRFDIQFYSTYLDTSTGATVTSETQTSDVYRFIEGGISKQQEIILGLAGKSVWQWMIDEKKFLNQYPALMPVSETTPLRLFWINRAGNTNCRVKVKKYYTSGAAAVEAETINQTSGDYEAVEVVLDPNVVFSNASDRAAISKFEVWLSDGTNVISEVHSFTLLHTYFERNYYFLFLESLGGFSSAWARGYAEKGGEISKQSWAKDLPWVPSATTSELFSSRGSIGKKIKSDFGYLDTEAEQDFITDFLASEKVFVVDGTRVWPVVIDGGQFTSWDDLADILPRPFEWQLAFADSYLTK